MNRSEVINNLIITNRYRSYLEIGTQYKINFDKIICDKKISVDPEKNNQIYDYNMTSDEFFNQNTQMFDIIFIDGMHLAEQVEKDILNSLRFLNINGCIVLHDTNPPTEFHQIEGGTKSTKQTPAGAQWTGTVWKAIFKLRKTRKDLVFKTYADDFGVTVISRGSGELLSIDNEYFSYAIFDKYRDEILNIVKEYE